MTKNNIFNLFFVIVIFLIMILIGYIILQNFGESLRYACNNSNYIDPKFNLTECNITYLVLGA